MPPMTIAKSDVAAFLATLAPEYRVVVPRRVTGADVVFADFDEAAPLAWDFVNTSVPPKGLFVPPREVLFHIDGTRRPALRAPAAEKPIAIFGLRSCDATGLAFLERFFAGRGFEDDAVLGRIRASLRMTVSCEAPGPDCFCVCCDGGPWLTAGFDLQFADLGARLLVDVGSARGEAAIAVAPMLFQPAGADAVAARARQVAEVDARFERRSYMAAGTKRISLGRVPQEKWEQWADDCQGCGGCCFVCPTCSCFTVTDRATAPGAFDRERAWDACLYEGFTREASGHNPRAARGDRLKRRFFHKMSYQYIEVMGRHGCVGCGRCVGACLGGLDISSVLARIHDECQ
ncbi:MAG TPA: 4Fe-4S dicluster domain-containing protein [Vicinamibacterales bacterium]|nr:4Fe-4S dicluster domain-containing protein [Vicinamibacterales bacterium]